MIGKRILTLFVCFSLMGLLKGQDSVVDSLNSLLKKANTDSVRLNFLTQLGQNVTHSSPWLAMDYFIQAKDLSIKLNDTNRIVDCLIGICDIYSINGEYKNAFEQLSEALTYAEDNDSLLATCHNRLSIEYDNLGKFEESVKHDRLSLYYHKLCNDSIEMSNDLHNIGTYHLRLKEADSAIFYYKLSNYLIKDSINILSAYNNSRIGLAMSLKNKYQEAKNYHLRSLAKFKKDNDNFEIANEYKHLALISLNTNNKEDLIHYTDSGISIAKDINNPKLLISLYQIYYDYYLKGQDYKNALDYKNIQDIYRDSLVKRNQESAIQNLEAKQQIEKQNRILEITTANNQILRKKQIFLIIISSVSIVLLIVSIIVLIVNRKQNKKNEELLEKLNEVNNFQKTLISIIGHDLINYVGNLKSFVELISTRKIDKAAIDNIFSSLVPMVNSTFDLLNNLIIWSKTSQGQYALNYETISSQNLIEETVTQMQNLAQSKQISFHTKVESENFEGDSNMLQTVLRNLISNAIKFSHSGSDIYINSYSKSGKVYLSIKDCGVGISEEQVSNIFKIKNNDYSKGTLGESGSGLGLGFCSSFIKKHHGTISVESLPGKGCTFHIVLPQYQQIT